jgi:ketosteroid isomerase-like protein
MSANLELVRSIFAAWERGDFSSADWADPEIEFGLLGQGQEPSSRTGLAEMGAAWRDVLSAWDECRIAADEYREPDGERVLVLSRASGRSKTSGLELSELGIASAVLFRLQDGKVTHIGVYGDREAVLADLGLAE